jgi:hypothetical protein
MKITGRLRRTNSYDVSMKGFRDMDVEAPWRRSSLRSYQHNRRCTLEGLCCLEGDLPASGKIGLSYVKKKNPDRKSKREEKKAASWSEGQRSEAAVLGKLDQEWLQGYELISHSATFEIGRNWRIVCRCDSDKFNYGTITTLIFHNSL